MLRTALIRLTAGVLALAGTAAVVVPSASAAEASLVITVDHRDWRDHRDDDRRRWDDHRRWDGDRRWDDRDRYERRHDRRERRADRHHRVREICEPTWRVKRSYDRYGRVDKVVRVRVTECRLVRR
ncbi:hypothetical protein [Mongoliimonas terrestris]|uniref:hypothetical protein n=1 Tax=Mongoliimonas terrestris TaxID=1709001 RepID=UPI000B044B79|nr:hypothetical protein [Mongoliimonas terrestris]